MNYLQQYMKNTNKFYKYTKKILTISHYPILPPTYGGPIRIYNLYVNLIKYYKFKNFSLSLKNPFLKSKSLNTFNVNFFFLPIYSLIAFPFWLMKLSYGFIFSFYKILGKIPENLKKAIYSADLIIIEEPYLFNWIYKIFPNKKYLIDCQNVEYDLVQQNYKYVNPILKKLVSYLIFKMEKYALQNADKITAVSENDKKRLVKLYKINSQKIDVIKNGFTMYKKVENIVSKNFKKILKQKSGIDFEYLVIFVGSEHKPNKDALKIIINLAKMPYKENVLFLIVGGVGNQNNNVYGQNIYYTGVVKDVNPYMQIADIAINPIISGSGTNIKLLEYLSSGIPTITTKKGARGINDMNLSFIVSTINNFYLNINILLTDEKLRKTLSIKAMNLASRLDNWQKISKKMKLVIDKIIL